jgi:hypothetical protein
MKKKIVHFFWLAFFFSGMLLTIKSVHGQTYKTFNDDVNYINTQTRWRLGPLRLYPMLQLSNIGYDSNVYYSPEGFASISDYTGTLSFRMDAYFLFRNWLIFSFSENPSYLYFVEQKGQRYFGNSYAFSLRILAFSRIALSGISQFTRQRTRGSTEIDARILEQIKQTSGSIFYETARNTSFGFTGVIRNLKYEDVTVPGTEDPLSVSQNREERSAQGELYYRVFSDSSFFVNFGYVEYSFEYPQSQFRDSYSYQFNSGIRFPLLGKARGVLSLGFKKLIPRREELHGFSGLVGNTSVNYRFGRFSYTLEFSRDVPFSVFTNNIFYMENRYGIGISFYLNRFIRLDYNFNFGENKYPEAQIAVLPNGNYEEIKRKDIYDIHSGAIVFRIVKNTGIGIRADYWERRSDYPGVNVHRLFVGGFLTYEF